MAQETTTAMYGRAAIVFAQLASEVEDPAAKEYWGDFSNDDGKNKFEALNLCELSLMSSEELFLTV
jgi:hypothetical protein